MHLVSLLRDEVRRFAALNASDRPWLMPVAAAAATGVPVAIGVAVGAPAQGVLASLGGLLFLYLPPTALSHRMAHLMACAFGLTSSFALGMLTQMLPVLAVPMLVVIASLVTMISRVYSLPPPGSFFFVMAAAMGAYTPGAGPALATNVGLLSLGCLGATFIAFVYSLAILRRVAPRPPPVHDKLSFELVVVDSIIIGAFVGIALGVALALQMPRPYWVPVSCLAVLQGNSLRTMWSRQLHRIAGTVVGLGIFWLIALLHPGPWGVALAIALLTFVIESLVVRHYGLAMAFITPLTILLAEAAQPLADAQGIMSARLHDTLLGCAVGVAGGICLHSSRLRQWLGASLSLRS
ncbi:MAG: FUSC family protein [Pseudomonadota bacterium]